MQDQLFRALVQHARDMVLLMTTDGSLVFANAAAETAYGYSAQEFAGLHIRDLRDASTLSELPSDMRRASTGILFETLHKDRTGHTFPVEVSSREVELSGERYLLSVIRDISERFDRREERERLVEDLEIANRQLEGVLSIVSSTVGVLDVATLLRGVMVALREIMNADASMLFFVEGDELVLWSYDGLSEDASGFRMGVQEGFAGRVGLMGEPQWTQDVTKDDVSTVWMHAHYGFMAMYGMPLYLDGDLFGVLECAWTTNRLVSQAERVMLQVAADRVVSAIVGAQRHERTARAQKLDSALHLAADRLSGSHDLHETMPAALGVAAEALDCEVAVFGTYREGVWRSVYCVGMQPGVVVSVPDHPSRTATSKESVPVICIDAESASAHWLASALGLAEASVVPVVLGGDWVGAALFGRTANNGGFDDLACDFARRLSASMSLALANAREYDAEHRIAETLQEALLRIDESLVGVPVGHLYHASTSASRVGGDFYDVFRLPDDRTALLIGDVSGKGLDAAVFTTLVKHTVRAFAHEESSPAAAVTRANGVLASAARLPDFASLMLFYLDTATGDAVFCCAGHPPALIRRAGGRVEAIACGSPVVGAFIELEYSEATTHLGPGDVIVFYTDGATDARRPDGDFFGDERLEDAVRRSTDPAETLAAALHAEIMAFSGGISSDDIAIMTLGIPL